MKKEHWPVTEDDILLYLYQNSGTINIEMDNFWKRFSSSQEYFELIVFESRKAGNIEACPELHTYRLTDQGMFNAIQLRVDMLTRANNRLHYLITAIIAAVVISIIVTTQIVLPK